MHEVPAKTALPRACQTGHVPSSGVRRGRRFVVRRDPIEQGEQLSLEGAEWGYWALITNDGERSADELERWHRAKANVENRIKEAKLGVGLDNLPCPGFHANWPIAKRLSQPCHPGERSWVKIKNRHYWRYQPSSRRLNAGGAARPSTFSTR